MKEYFKITEWIQITDTHATFRCANGKIYHCPIGQLLINEADLPSLKKAIEQEKKQRELK